MQLRAQIRHDFARDTVKTIVLPHQKQIVLSACLLVSWLFQGQEQWLVSLIFHAVLH